MHQTCGGHAGVVQREPFQVLEPAEVRQPRVGDPGLSELEHFELRQAGQRNQAGIGDLRPIEIQPAQVVQPGQLFQSGVAGSPGDDLNRLAAVVLLLGNRGTPAGELLQGGAFSIAAGSADQGQRRSGGTRCRLVGSLGPGAQIASAAQQAARARRCPIGIQRLSMAHAAGRDSVRLPGPGGGKRRSPQKLNA